VKPHPVKVQLSIDLATNGGRTEKAGVEGADFYTGDPHMVHGDGEVALTALGHSLRRRSVLLC
jgi:hypothetical protein